MGLTVAEAFMLIAFVLLMLLLFWRYQVQDDVKFARDVPPEQRRALSDGHVLVPPRRLAVLEEAQRLVADPNRRDLAKAAAKLQPSQLRRLTDLARKPDALTAEAALVPSKRLEDLQNAARLVEDPARRDLATEAAKLRPKELRKLTDMARKPQTLASENTLVPKDRLAALEETERLVTDPAQRDLATEAAKLGLEELRKLTDMARKPQTLASENTLVPKDRLAALKETERLVADPARRDLAEEATKLRPEQVRQLTNMARDPEALAGETARVSHERLAELEGLEKRLAGRDVAEVEEALALRDELDPYGEDSNEDLLKKIGELQAQQELVDAKLAEEARARKDFVERMRRQLAESVRAAGGRIDATGRIVFPETVFFEAGQAQIVPRFRSMLDNICPRWLTTLREGSEKLDVDEIRIEGHSSPEWRNATSEQEAWVQNLSLSQRRAQSVLVYCLEHVGPTLREWARRKLTAVGYSSSRPMRTGDSEDWRKSRRVVLGLDFSRDRLIAGLRDTTTTGSGAIKPIRGNAQIKDADTIEIEDIGIRLDGIDAPELDQVCAKNGIEWPCGREAASALKRRINGRVVICNDLQPGLQRLRGRCRVDGDSEDLNSWLTNGGWAFAYTKYSGEYTNDEAAARRARRGIWAGDEPMPPWEWRRRNR